MAGSQKAGATLVSASTAANKYFTGGASRQSPDPHADRNVRLRLWSDLDFAVAGYFLAKNNSLTRLSVTKTRIVAIRHEQSVGHSFLEMSDHGTLGAGDRD